jgi:hypothetical protein
MTLSCVARVPQVPLAVTALHCALAGLCSNPSCLHLCPKHKASHTRHLVMVLMACPALEMTVSCGASMSAVSWSYSGVPGGIM